MANTKALDPKARRKAKKQSRHQAKKDFQALTLQQKKKLRKFEGTFKQFMAEQQKEKEKEKAAEA